MSIWLLLNEPDDPVGPWLADGLTARGLDPVLNLTLSDLIRSGTWVHTVGDGGAAFTVSLSDEIALSSASIAGVVNRIGFIDPTHTATFAEGDREYALHELNGFFVSWLNALDAPVLNPPSPRGLAGAWRPASEWACLAKRAGLRHRPIRSTDAETMPFGQPSHRTAFVLGGEIVEDGLDDETHLACLRLAELSSTPLLGIQFESDGHGGLVFTGASPQPPLWLAGDAILDALAYVFERTPV